MTSETKNAAFGSDEMITCSKCGKSNPPNRAGCLYCGAPLDVPEDLRGSVKLNLRKLENWENGFNVVIVGRADTVDLASAGQYLKLDNELFGRMVEAKDPFPLARLESEPYSAAAAKRFSAFGLTTQLVRDVDLKIGKPNTRLRSVEFGGDRVVFTSFNTSEQRSLLAGEVSLIVIGTIVESRKESVEKGRKDKRKVLAESATTSDDLLIDIYPGDSTQGWRVTTKGFDFSTLGSEKRLLAAQNIQLLLEKLKAFAPAAKAVDEYAQLMAPLTEVWDIEHGIDFQGLRRTGMLRSGFASVARTSNLEQFSKYSRLQRKLL